MNIVEAFANWLQDESVATLGQDLFISRARATPDALYWLVSSGGTPVIKNFNNGFQIGHTIAVYYRNNSASEVYNKLHELQEMVLTKGCFELEGFTVVTLTTNGPFTDQDLDDNERTVGLLEITITTYKE